MANQTITSDANHDDLTGRNAGENITINVGATLTIDSMPQYTAMGLLGEVNTTDGTWIVDSRFIKEFAYSGGTGTLPVVGDIITDSGGASGKVIRLNSGTATSGVMTVTQQSGTFTATNTLTSGTFNATLDSVKVGFLELFFEQGNNNVATGLGTIDWKGDWYEIGVGDGTDSQAFTLPHDGIQCGIWVETGSGTDVFEKWVRIQDSDAFTNYQTGDLGKVFKQTIDTANVTFGTSTQGEAPPNGARIRIQNLHVGTATLAAPTTEIPIATSTQNDYVEIETNSSATMIFDKVNFSSFRSQWVGADSVTMTNCSMAINNQTTFNNQVSGNFLTDCVFGAYRDMGAAVQFQFNDNALIQATRCKWHCPDNFANGIQIATSSNITLDDCWIMYGDKDQSQSKKRFTITNCTNATINNLKLIGPELYILAGSSNITINNLNYSANTDGVLRTSGATDVFSLTQGSNNIVIDGFDIISGGSPPRDEVVSFADAVNCTVKNIGGINSKIDLQNHSDHVVLFGGSTSGCKVQRCFFDNQGDVEAFSFGNAASNNLIENCSGKYNSRSTVDGVNNMAKGAHMASGDFNANSGIEIDYPLAAGNIFQDVFTSDTTGRLHAVFQPAGEKSQYVNISGSSVLFRKDGDLYIRTAGDFIEIESPYEIKGHTGFQNVDYDINGSNTGNLDVEYAIDTGSGFGAYKAATGANLSAESISPSGFRFKWKITANASNNNNLINGLRVETTTTLTDQENNFYPLGVVEITTTVLDSSFNPIEGARVYLKETIGGDVVLNGLTDANGVVTNSLEFSSDVAIDGWARKSSPSGTLYQQFTLGGTLTSNGASLTAIMQEDE